MKTKVEGECTVDISMDSTTFTSVHVGVVAELVADVLIGRGLQQKFEGTLSWEDGKAIHG